MTATFESDPKIGEIFEAYSLDCIDWATSNFGINLAVSQEGVRNIEAMADILFNSMPPGGAPPEMVVKAEKMLGSHIAQVLIKVKGWTPGMAKFEQGEFPAVELPGKNMCWPWGKAHNRMINGSEDNLWHYYLGVTDQLGAPIEEFNQLR